MAGETISTNMGMPIPGVGNTTGPTWASDLNTSLNIIDGHNHSIGSGVQITPDGLNINSDLSFGSNNALSLLKAGFTSQLSALTGTNFLSFVAGNLYVNDGSGNQIPITAGGGVAGSPGSIGSLTSPASATYSAGSKLFLWQSGSSKAAAMDNGAITIRETDVASAKGITIASPVSLAADYNLTLPTALPASTRYLSGDNSGNLGFVTAQSILTAGNPSNNWSPVFSLSSGSITANVGASDYWQVGHLIFYIIYIQISSITASKTGFIMTAPVPPELGGLQSSYGGGVYIKTGTSASSYAFVIDADDELTMQVGILSTSGTLAAGDIFRLQGFYSVP